MAVVIPLRNDLPVYSFQVELDGQTYGIEMRWNFRSLQWALSLFDAEGLPIFYNAGAAVDFPIGRRIQDERMPPGVLLFKDSSGAHAEPGFADLGARVQLLYLSKTELL